MNASQAVVLPTFLAMPVFSNDPPYATRYSPMAKTFPGGMQFLDRVSSLCHELMTKSGQQSVKATFSSGDKRILRGYYAYGNEVQTKNCKA